MQELCRRSENGEPQRLCAIQLSASQEAALLGDYSPLLLRKKASPLLKRETYHLEGGRTFLLSNAGNLIFGPARAVWRPRDLFPNACICAGGSGIGQGLWSCRTTARMAWRWSHRALRDASGGASTRGATASQRPPPADSLFFDEFGAGNRCDQCTHAHPVRVYRESSQCPAVVAHSMLRRPALPACPVRHAR